MGKKTKSKQRLDAYYHFAKQQGYRSRAAYKLIQLNRKYNLLTHSKILIDLCAAPGGWMQVASQCMPLNSTIVGVDLDPIKRIPGTKSFQGDITTPACYEQLRKEIKNQKCDVVLNDGAPNVGANWSKDAYTQSQLVLAALKLACSFLREGGYFVTKVFRSTDFSSLMWVFKKFFEKVEATKPKASRFSSAQIFVVCAGYLAPSFIDQKLFDAKFIFQDTEADHFQEQLAGQITSIDKLLQDRRKRGGYEDNAPMHLYKEASLTQLIDSDTPLLIFASYNKITTTLEQRNKYYGIVKNMPKDIEEMFQDIRVLGKREIGNILKWRGKIRHHFNLIAAKEEQTVQKQEEALVHEEEDSQVLLQKQVLQAKRRQIKHIKEKQQRHGELMVKSQLANEQRHSDEDDLGEDIDEVFGSDIEQLGYDPEPIAQDDDKAEKKLKLATYNQKQMQKNLQEIYEARKKIKEEKQERIRQVKQDRKELMDQRARNRQFKLKSRKIGADPSIVQGYEQEQQQQENQLFQNRTEEIKFRNPLADMEDEDLYISENQQEQDDNLVVDPNQKVQGELSDDEAYAIPKPVSDMQKRRKVMKKNKQKQQKKLKKDIIEGQDVGGQIQIVKRKEMEDYNIDQLAQTLAIAKKMLRNRSREGVINSSYGRYSFQDHDELPKWFTEDQKKHNFKKPPITKQQFQREKDRLVAINARVPKKIMQAKVRRKMRVQKKLKKTQKLAQNVMNQQGVTEYNKLKQVGKMYEKIKHNLKDKKKYVVSSKSRTNSGKDSRNVKHVDSRMKKDKRSLKIKKNRHVHRKNKSKAKF